jgi:hypothetical protein
MSSSQATAGDNSGVPEMTTANLQATYSNMVRGLMTAEEIMLDFGFNPNSGGKVVDEPVDLRTRVILSIPSAARLHQLLHTLLTKRQEAVQQAMARQQETAPASTPPA